MQREMNSWMDGWVNGWWMEGGKEGWMDRLNSLMVANVCPITSGWLVGPQINRPFLRATEMQEPVNSEGQASERGIAEEVLQPFREKANLTQRKTCQRTSAHSRAWQAGVCGSHMLTGA